jgi:hypothetical protein
MRLVNLDEALQSASATPTDTSVARLAEQPTDDAFGERPRARRKERRRGLQEPIGEPLDARHDRHDRDEEQQEREEREQEVEREAGGERRHVMPAEAPEERVQELDRRA